jgi:hypothetical protein
MTDKRGNENIDGPGSTDDSPEYDEMLSSFEKAESQRRRKGIIYALIGLMIGAGLFLLAFVYRDEVFGPPIDVEEGEEKILDMTDDPECRDMIAQVHTLSERYFKLETAIDEKLLGDDPQAIQEIRDEITRLQQRVDEIEEDSQEANLRFDDSRKELKEWFDYVSLEFSFIDRLAKERLAELNAAELNAAELNAAGDDSAEKDPAELKDGAEGAKKKEDSKTADGEQAPEQAQQEEGVVVEKSKETQKKEQRAANQKSPKERKEGALVAIHDAFQKFRVWHSSSAHPCGAADEGEKPWRPANHESPREQQ